MTGPGHLLVVADLEQEIELLRKQRVVVVEIEAEQRKGVDERATADDHLRPSVGDKVERREILEQPHRIGRAEDRHGARQANSLGACRGGGEDHRGSRVEELFAMVLPYPEYIEPDLIGVFDLFEQIAHAIRLTDREARLG